MPLYILNYCRVFTKNLVFPCDKKTQAKTKNIKIKLNKAVSPIFGTQKMEI